MTTLYQNTETGAYGLTASSLRAILTHVSFPDDADLTDHGFKPYEATPTPQPQWYQTVVEVEPLEGEQQWAFVDTAQALTDLKAQRLEDLAQRRKSACQNFSFMGLPLKLDTDTESAISKAIQALARQPEGATIQWEVMRGMIQEFDLIGLELLGDAAFLHVQACFSNVATLTAAILAAPTLADLVEIDLNDGWPE